MVSISKIGNIAFTKAPLVMDAPVDKDKAKKFAISQKNMGYSALSAGALALAGTAMFKNKATRIITVLPATLLAGSFGLSLISASKAIHKAAEAVKPVPLGKPENTKTDIKA